MLRAIQHWADWHLLIAVHEQAENVPHISSYASLSELWRDYAEGNPALGRLAMAAKEAAWVAAGKPRDKCWRAKKDKDTWYVS